MAVWITRRKTRTGETRFHVRMQVSSYAKQRHLGAFKTLREAELRKRWALDEIASGRTPDRGVIHVEPDAVLLADAARGYVESRLDASDSTRATYAKNARYLVEALGNPDLRTLSRRDVQAWVTRLAESHKRATIHARVTLLRQIYTHTGLASPTIGVRLPRSDQPRIRIPSTATLEAMYACMSERFHPPVRFLERTGLRVSELAALSWVDVDEAGARVLVGSKTGASRRWVDLAAPPLATAVLPERSGVSVFGESDYAIRGALARAAADAGVGRYSPHDLRHLHASRLLRAGWDAARIAARLGHAHAGITLRVYAHAIWED